MKPERLSDAELGVLVREGGASAGAALGELENRHSAAVRTFAEICAPGTAGDELAARAWQSAVRHPDAGVTVALRPYALRSVLRTAAEWTESGYPARLDEGLTAWLAMLPTSWDADSPGGDTAFLGPGSVVAWAFDALPVTLRTVLWHHSVERSGNDAIARLLGSESPEAQEVSVLVRRAHRGFYRAYEQIHQGGMSDDCRRFHRMVMAYADRGGREGGNTGDVVAHLEGCAYCSRAVADLKQLRAQPRELLARELLPWGGERYAAGRGSDSAWVSATITVPLDGDPLTGPEPVTGPLADLVTAPGSTGAGAGAGFGAEAAFGAAPGAASGSAAGAAAGAGRGGPDGVNSPATDGFPASGGPARAGRSGRGGPGKGTGYARGTGARTGAGRGAGDGSGRRPGRRGTAGRRPGARARRLSLALGVLGVCALTAVLGYAQYNGANPLEPSAEQPAGGRPSAPSPSKSGAQPSGSPDAPSRPGGQDGRTDPPSSGDGGGKGGGKDSSPAVPGAALEWLFGGKGGDAAQDSSGSGRDGRLVGTPPPEPQGAEGMAFFGQQSVTSRGPVLDTDRGFSVSARVKLRNKDDYQTVASQDGEEISSFQLQYDAVEDRWEMRMHRSDSQTSAADEAESDSAPRAGRWTHLTGVWDPSREEIRLYVDGRLEDTVGRVGDTSSEGGFAVGRARLGDRLIRGLDGNVKQVRAYAKVLTEEQVRRLAAED